MVRVAGVRLAKKICSILVSITPLATEVMERCAVFNLRRVYGNFSSSFIVGDPCRIQDFHKAKFLPDQNGIGSDSFSTLVKILA
jgi:hypothetical protein